MEEKKKNRKKRPWHLGFLVPAVYGLFSLLEKVAVWLLYLFQKDPVLLSKDAVSVGIIGGADGPTSIFVATPGWVSWAVPLLCLLIGLAGFLRFRNKS